MAAPPPGTAPTVLPTPISAPSTVSTTGPVVMPPGIDVSGPPVGGLNAPTLASTPPQIRGPPPSVAMPPPPGMEVCILFLILRVFLSMIYSLSIYGQIVNKSH